MNKGKAITSIGLAYHAGIRKPFCLLFRNISYRKLFLCAIYFVYCISCFANETNKIVLLLSGSSQVYQTVAKDTIRDIKKKCAIEEVNCSGLTFETVVIDGDTDTHINDAQIMVVFGTKAASDANAVNFDRQMIISMIPKQSSINLDDKLSAQRVTRIYIDQPFERYLALIKTIAPRASRIGLLLHSSDAPQREPMIKAAEQAGLILTIGMVESNDDIGESLSRLLANIDILLALPDSRIHNSNTISNILTTSYRNHIPVIGFSSAYVKAGATAAVYTSLRDISHQASDVVLQMLRNENTEGQNLTAKYFSVSFNFEVARSLGISLHSPSEIKETMLKGISK